MSKKMRRRRPYVIMDTHSRTTNMIWPATKLNSQHTAATKGRI
jgi:hypothetical protein